MRPATCLRNWISEFHTKGGSGEIPLGSRGLMLGETLGIRAGLDWIFRLRIPLLALIRGVFFSVGDGFLALVAVVGRIDGVREGVRLLELSVGVVMSSLPGLVDACAL